MQALEDIKQSWRIGFCDELKYYSPLVEIMSHIDSLEGHVIALNSLQELLKSIIKRANCQVIGL